MFSENVRTNFAHYTYEIPCKKILDEYRIQFQNQIRTKNHSSKQLTMLYDVIRLPKY